MKTYYKRKLPHIQPVGATFFVTFRLAGSIPKTAIGALKLKYVEEIERSRSISNEHDKNLKIFNLRKQYLFEVDELLHKIEMGPHHLQELEIMEVVENELKRFDGELYDLICYSIMSNHVHILIDTQQQLRNEFKEEQLELNYVPLDAVMKRIKGSTAVYSNRILSNSGQFWERESYDIYIRNEKMLNNVVGYILNNPVKAGLVREWTQYPGNYYKYDEFG